jgi:predicted Zn-dependent peptidase
MKPASRILPALFLAAAPLSAQQPDRSAPPALGPAPSLSLPALQRLELSNGLRVVLMEKHDVPLVQANLVVRVGTVHDPAGAVGLADFTGAMLDEGAGELDALALADEIAFLGAELGVGVDEHTTRIALHTPLAKLDPALGLMADVALRPRFDPEELERQRRNRLTTLLQWHDEPRAVMQVLFPRVLFGEVHPYGHSDLGSEASIRAVSVDDMRAFHQRHFVPGNAVLIVVGDVTAAEVQPKLESAFGGWRGGNAPAVSVPAAPQVAGRQVYLVDKPGAAQSEVVVARIGVARSTEDYYALLVMNTILGGSFASRLNQKLREEKQYTYGARSSFLFRPAPGPFAASASVQTDVTDSSLVEFMNELRAIREPVTDEELTRARNFVALRFPGSFQSVAQIADRLEDLVVYGLPDDYFNQYVQRILAVTKADVQRVAEKYIDADNVAIMVVGDRERVEAGIRALNLGPVHLMSIQDVLGSPPVIESSD